MNKSNDNGIGFDVSRFESTAAEFGFGLWRFVREVTHLVLILDGRALLYRRPDTCLFTKAMLGLEPLESCVRRAPIVSPIMLQAQFYK